MAAAHNFTRYTDAQLVTEEARLRAARERVLSSFGDSGTNSTVLLSRIDEQYNACVAEMDARALASSGRTVTVKRVAQSRVTTSGGIGL